VKKTRGDWGSSPRFFPLFRSLYLLSESLEQAKRKRKGYSKRRFIALLSARDHQRVTNAIFNFQSQVGAIPEFSCKCYTLGVLILTFFTVLLQER